MRRRVLAALAFLCFAMPAAAEPDTEAWRREVMAVETAWNKAVSDRDPKTIEGILDDRFVFVGPNGAMADKAGLVAMAATPDATVEPFVTENVNVRFYGETAVVTGHFDQRGTWKGKPFASRYAYTDVYVRGPSGWKAVSAHATLVPQAK
ncbi:MAG TPA: nuclear transport factor 2 family protein [Azospirillaceae bacterium]|nr:nuclear transport factor 2 family protein [Azospirillaceae bacterium]